MSTISNLSGLSSLGAQYDFTSMTNAQLKSIALQLGSEGKISTNVQQEMIAEAYGCNEYTPGSTETADQHLNDPTKQDFLSYYTGCLQTAENWNISPKTTELMQDVVNSMEQNQSATAAGSASIL